MTFPVSPQQAPQAAPAALLRNPFQAPPPSAGGMPSLTWKGAPVNAYFMDAVILPQMVEGDRPGETVRAAYKMSQQTKRVVGPDGSATYVPQFFDDDPLKPMPQIEMAISIQDLQSPERWLTADFIKAAGAPQDDAARAALLAFVIRMGIRRLFVKGSDRTPGSGTYELLTACKSAGTVEPQIGGLLSVRLTGRAPNKHGGETNMFGMRYLPPTPASMAIVAEYDRELPAAPPPASSPFAQNAQAPAQQGPPPAWAQPAAPAAPVGPVGPWAAAAATQQPAAAPVQPPVAPTPW